MTNGVYGFADFRLGANSFSGLPVVSSYGYNSNFGRDANAEFGGPLEIALSGAYLLVSYVLTEQVQSLPQQSVLQGPTGNFRVLVEKSTNLTNWIPSAIIDLRDDQKAFYRFRISK